MIAYFSIKLNVLEISNTIVLLLDILATFRVLFHHCSPNAEWATILQAILVF